MSIELKNAERLFPQFILNDRNGRAMAAAILAGLDGMVRSMEDAITLLTDVSQMPEWRLDEMAWEYNCLYDYAADIEQKRAWIREAVPIYRYYGTPYAIRRYLNGAFENVYVRENWQYGGEPYHFRVVVDTEYSDEKLSWIHHAVETVKNVRSALDAVEFTAVRRQQLHVGHAVHGKASMQMRMSKTAIDGRYWYVDENGDMLLDENGNMLYAEGGTV